MTREEIAEKALDALAEEAIEAWSQMARHIREVIDAFDKTT